jgi:hypothetical protein
MSRLRCRVSVTSAVAATWLEPMAAVGALGTVAGLGDGAGVPATGSLAALPPPPPPHPDSTAQAANSAASVTGMERWLMTGRGQSGGTGI